MSKENVKDPEAEVGGGADGRERVDPRLLGYIFEPTEERMPEMTDLPLKMIPVLTWMATYDTAAELMANFAEYIQKRKNGNRDAEEPKRELLTERWRKMFYKHRRSLNGDNLMRAATLANKQLEMEQIGEEQDQILRTG